MQPSHPQLTESQAEALAAPLSEFTASRASLFATNAELPFFERLRNEDPIHWCETGNYEPHWSITRYADIAAVDLDHKRFSSAEAITLRTPEAIEFNRYQSNDGAGFITMDQPDHGPQRKAVGPVVQPPNLAKLSVLLRERAEKLLDSLPIGETFDWVDKVSIELTTGMLAILFGFPWEDRRLLTFWSDWSGDTELASVRELDKMRWEILHEMGAYFQSLWAERMQDPEPGDDLISMMIHSEAMNQMRPEEFMGNLVLLIVGGNDTTRNSMSGFVYQLDKNPDERRKFEEDPSVIPNAVQEMLRLQTPLAHMRRTCTEDTEVFGQTIKKGDKVVLWYLSANRDEDVFENPDALDLTRDNARRHIAFGYGIHRCVGARLAELQLKILLEEMHKRRLRVDVVGDVERVRANFVHGFRKLEVQVSTF